MAWASAFIALFPVVSNFWCPWLAAQHLLKATGNCMLCNIKSKWETFGILLGNWSQQQECNRYTIFSSGHNLNSGFLACEARITKKNWNNFYFMNKDRKIWVLLLLFFIYENFHNVYNHIWSFLHLFSKSNSFHVFLKIHSLPSLLILISSKLSRDASMCMGVRHPDPVEHENPPNCDTLQ